MRSNLMDDINKQLRHLETIYLGFIISVNVAFAILSL